MNTWYIILGVAAAVAIGGLLALFRGDAPAHSDTAEKPSSVVEQASVAPERAYSFTSAPVVSPAYEPPPESVVVPMVQERSAPAIQSPPPKPVNQLAEAERQLDRFRKENTLSQDIIPTYQELQKRAVRVQAKTNEKLDQLTRDLGLSDEQREQVFPILARHALDYHPLMDIDGGDAAARVTGSASATTSPAPTQTAETADTAASNQAVPVVNIDTATTTSLPIGTPIDPASPEIYPLLTAEQQQAFAEELINQDLWWTEIIGLLDKDEETNDLAAPSVTDEEIEDGSDPIDPLPPEDHPGGNLWDLLHGSK